MTTRSRRDSARRSPGGSDRARRCVAAVVATLLALTAAGCATRYDGQGVTRVGIGLWGFGDPPVNWNLDWPRRAIPELPPASYPDLAPRRAPPADLPPRRSSTPIDDNRGRVPG